MTTTNPSLADLLQHFTSPNNDIRHEAEKYYNSLLQTSPDEVVIGLMQIMANEQIPFHIRQLAAILLRRCLIDEEDSYYFKLQLQSRHYVINEISRLLLQEQNTAIRIKITDIAGELGGSILEPKDWPNLYPTMIQLCNSGNPADREVGLSLLGLLAASAISSYDDFLPTASQVLLFNFQQNSQEGKGLTLTIRALNDVVSSVKLTTQLEVLQSLVPPLFQSISSLLEQTISIVSSNPLSHPSSPLPNNSLQFNNNNGNTNLGKLNLQALCNCFETLIDIADHSSIYFQPYLQMIVFPLLDYLETNHLTFKLFTFGFHSLILEYLVTLSIHETKKIKKCKGPNNEKEYFITRILPICLQYMAILPKENHWETADTVEEIHYDSSYHDIGEAAFRRCISVFGIKSTYTIISTLLSHYLTSNDWEKVYAGLQCLSGYVEITVNISNPSQLLLHRKEVTQTIHHFITNAPHPRVRYNAFYALSQFILFHGNELTTSVLQDFIQLIGQHTRQAANSSPRIRRNALIALIQLIDISSASFVSQHVSYLLEIICSALQEGPTIVQESCVSAIISIAETSRGNTELWNHYYPLIMPILKQLFSFSQKKSLESLWCQTLECISALGESAGKSLFYEDACDLMNLLTSIQSTLQQHSSLESTLLKAWVRLGRCLGSEFLPYLPSIMEKLFEALSQDIIANPQELENRRNKGGDDDDDLDLDMDDEGGDEEDEDNEFQTIETANGWVTVRTSAVEEQSSSLQMILLLTEKLQEYYYPYIEQTISHLTKLLASPNEDIRSYSIVILPELIRSIGKALPSNRNPLKELTFFSLGKLIDLLEKESSLELIMTALQAIKQILLFACADWSDVLSHKEISVVPAITPTTFSNGMGEGSNANGSSNNAATNGVGANENLAAQGEGSEKKQWLKLLDDSQMLIITKSLKSILRESLQRRAVLKAEKQLEEREEPHQPAQTKASDDIHNKDTFEVEDVFNEEEMFFQQSLELHYNISEVINILFQTHSLSYLPIYYQEFHELIINFTNFFCLREDQRFAFLMISDVVEFGLNPTYTSSSTAVQPAASPVHTPTVPSQQQSVITSAQQRDMILSYLQQLFPILHAHCQHATNSVNATPSSSSKSKNRRRRAGSDEDATDDMNDDQSGQPDYELLRTIVYIIGIIFEHYSIPEFCVLLNQYLTPSLLSLHQIMSMILTAEMNNPQDDAKERSSDNEVVGMCKDNIISAIGMIAQKIFNGFPLSLLFPNNNASANNSGNGEHYLGENIIQIKQLEYLLNQWLQLLPLEFDQEENVKVMKQLLQFLYGHKSFAYLLQHVEMFHNAVTILIKEIELNRLSKSLIFQFHGILFEIFHKHQWQHQSIPQDVLNVSLQSFSPEQQLALQNILFAYPNLAQQQQQQQLQQQTNGVSESQQIAYHDVSTPIRINHSNSATSPVLATSPLATAPIHDVLINMK